VSSPSVSEDLSFAGGSNIHQFPLALFADPKYPSSMTRRADTPPQSPGDLDREFGTRIRAARAVQRISQQRLTDAVNSKFGLGWHSTTLVRVESGERPARLAEAVALADALDTPLDQLVFGTGRDSAEVAAVDLAWEELHQVQRQVSEMIDRRMQRLQLRATDAVVEQAQRRWLEQQGE
jgi:transcriptional regulator with XRE-family HTH domain